MKALVKVIACILLSVLAICDASAADSAATRVAREKARKLLSGSAQMISGITVDYVGDRKRTQGEKRLFERQIRAIRAFRGSRDVSIVPVLIPYLNYRTDGVPDFILRHRGAPPPSLQELKIRFPAFDTLLSIPRVAGVLVNYVRDSDQQTRYRLAALLVLKNVDSAMFAAACGSLKREFWRAGRQTKTYLKAVATGDATFDGIPSINERE